jgi:hypothetical protein
MTSLAKPNHGRRWRWTLAFLLILTLPLLGICFLGRPLAPYLSFPPRTDLVSHAPFSFGWSLVYAFVDLALLGGIIAALRAGRKRTPRQDRPHAAPWPWWGWAGLVLTILGWVLAWSRFAWFSALQRHVFILPWTGYLLTVNALTYRRTGGCLLTRRPLRLILLTGYSCLIWWVFEYLNRFVQNWYYVEVERFGQASYALLASLAFCTVLPVVMSTHELLLTSPLFNQGLACLPLKITALPKGLAWIGLALGCIGLTGMGVWPDPLFSLVWVAPLILLIAVDRLFSHSPLLTALEKGDYRPWVGSALAALICGFFWELWNAGSLAKWCYTLPYVQWGQIFEMPLLGYGGYLPFGVYCWLVSRPILSRFPAARKAQAPAADSHWPPT